MARSDHDIPNWLRRQPAVAPPGRAERIAAHTRMVERMKERRLSGDSVLEIAYDFGMNAAAVKRILGVD